MNADVRLLTLDNVDDRRCITPAHLIPVGRNDTFLETGRPLRLANLPRRST